MMTTTSDAPTCWFCLKDAAVLIRQPEAWGNGIPLCGVHALEKVDPWQVVELYEEAVAS